MEKWLTDMGFKPDDMNNFKKTFKEKCKPSMKDIWSHIICHIRPREEVQTIKKQCLLHKMRTRKDFTEYEVHLNSIQEFSIYKERKKEEYNLKKVLEEIEKKKQSIREHMNRLELSGLRIENEEELLKEKVYKLGHLRKKSITVNRIIEKLTNDTKLMQFITKEPYKVLGFGSEATTWERKVLMAVKALPKGSECQTILSGMIQLAKDSKLPPVSYWDRTEILSLIENNLMSMIEKRDHYNSKLQKEEYEIKELKDEIVAMVSQDNRYKDDIAKVLEDCEVNFLDCAESVAIELIHSKPPFKLAVQDRQIKSLQRQIDSKVKDINMLLPIESDAIIHEILSSKVELDYATDHLPTKLPVDNLLDSVAKEVSLFLKISLNDSKEINRKYVHIHLDSTSESQLKKLKQKLETLEKLISFENMINSLRVPSEGETSFEIFRDETDDFDKKLKETLNTVNSLLEKVKIKCKKLEEAFNFLKKEPLNEKLTGMEIDGKDISYWLKKYKDLQLRIDHEKLVLKSMQQKTKENN